MKNRLNFLSVLLLLFCSVGGANSQVVKNAPPIEQITDAPSAVAAMREFYKLRDYESGYESGRKLVERFPDDLELRAWFIVNTARNEMSKDAVEAAQKLVENNRENAWAQFALAHAYLRNSQTKEAAAVAEKAWRLAPGDEEFVFLFAASLSAQKKYADVYKLLDENAAKIKDRTRLLILKAETQYQQATDGKMDEARKKLAYETFAQAKEASPNSLAANYIYATYLYFDRRYDEALPLMKKAVALAPNVAHIRQYYWRAALRGQPAKSAEQTRTEVVADMNQFRRLRPDSVNALEAVSSFYGRGLEMSDKQRELDAVILKRFPQTTAAEIILLSKIRRFDTIGKDKKVDERKRLERVAMLRDFINRPKHFRENHLGEAYSNLFYEIKDDKKITDAELLQIAENVSRFPQFDAAHAHSMIAESLTERKMFREAEKFVNVGFEKTKADVERLDDSIEDEKELQKTADAMNALLHGALGWIYFRENRFDKAEKKLETAVKLDRLNSSLHKKSGEIYEAKNELDKAENAYINAYSTFYGKENPHLETLKSLYRKRHQNLENFAAYFETVKETERAMRRERVLSAKIAEPKRATPFNLKNLEARLLPFADLKGKVVVVNIWGTWCGPCVMEMPEFQELHKKYRTEKDVAILTINNDQDLETIRKFMNGKKYDFAVLRDENYLQSAGIGTFPTTWFIDREGKISFVKIGASDKLLEEFGWRIEELRKQSEEK